MKRFTATEKWDDAWFRGLPAAHKLVFLYIIDRCDNAGFWEVDAEALRWHTRLESDEIEGALKGLTRGLLGASGWIWVKNFIRHQQRAELSEANPAHRQIFSLLSDQVERFSEEAAFANFIAPYKGLLRPIGIGKGKGKGKGRGSAEGDLPPTVKHKGTAEEINAFFAELLLQESDAVWFFEKCQGNGWTNGGKPMKDWRATVRSWKAAGYLPSQRQPTGRGPNRNTGTPLRPEDQPKEFNPMADE